MLVPIISLELLQNKKPPHFKKNIISSTEWYGSWTTTFHLVIYKVRNCHFGCKSSIPDSTLSQNCAIPILCQSALTFNKSTIRSEIRSQVCCTQNLWIEVCRTDALYRKYFEHNYVEKKDFRLNYLKQMYFDQLSMLKTWDTVKHK